MLSAKNIGFDRITFHEGRLLGDRAFALEDERTRVRPGSVLLTIVGAIGRAAVVPEGSAAFCLQRSVAVLSPIAHHPRLLMYLLNARPTQQWLAAEAKGTAQKGVYLKTLGRMRLPLPPANEQRRIVVKLDSIFEQTRAAKLHLDRLPGLLDKLKRSILAAAFRGDLTADWRAAHPNVDSAAHLLDRVRAQRRRSWEAELRAKGKNPKKVEITESAIIETDALPELPPQWAWIRFPELLAGRGMRTGPFGTLLSKDDHRGAGVPVLGIENIGELRFVPGSKIHLDSEKADALAEYEAHAGDLLVSRSGTVGEVCVVPKDLGRAIISTNIIRVTSDTSLVDPLFLGYALTGSAHVLSQIGRLCSGSTRLFLNQGIMSALVVPVPPLDEQRALLETISQNFEVLNSLRSRGQRSSDRIVRLEQAALAKAFRGELVEQDPNDEPAAATLERMRETPSPAELPLRSRSKTPRTKQTRLTHQTGRQTRRSASVPEEAEG